MSNSRSSYSHLVNIPTLPMPSNSSLPTPPAQAIAAAAALLDSSDFISTSRRITVGMSTAARRAPKNSESESFNNAASMQPTRLISSANNAAAKPKLVANERAKLSTKSAKSSVKKSMKSPVSDEIGSVTSASAEFPQPMTSSQSVGVSTGSEFEQSDNENENDATEESDIGHRVRRSSSDRRRLSKRIKVVTSMKAKEKLESEKKEIEGKTKRKRERDAESEKRKRQRDLQEESKRFEGLQSRRLCGSAFSAWKYVRPEEIPTMTYEGYLDLAVENIDVATRAAIKRCVEYEPSNGEQYHLPPWDLIRGVEPSPLTLSRRVDLIYGKEEFRVTAKQNIPAKTVVTFLAGRLMEQSKASKETKDDSTQHFFMDASYLNRFFNYRSDHSLMISTRDHKNISAYIRDPCERTDGEGANVKVDVVFDPQGALFFVVLYADEPINRSEELFCLPYLGRWYSRVHRQMYLHARISHWYHRWAAKLELGLLEKNIKFDNSIPPGQVVVALTTQQELRFFPDEEARGNTYEISAEEAMKSFPLDEAFKVAQCEPTTMAFLQKEVSQEVRKALAEIPDFIPDRVDCRGVPTLVDRDAVIQLLTHGHSQELLEVREDRCIGGPVRYFEVPWRPSFCVVANKKIPAGTFLFTYGGEVGESVRNIGSCYVYNLIPEDIQRTIPQYKAPQLYLDALKFGNISRFVNDNRYRIGEDENEGSTANIECIYLYYHGMIHLAFYSNRIIEKDEEIISQYGDDFWKTINSRLIDEHKLYFEYSSLYTRKLEELYNINQLELPEKPDYMIEKEKFFIPKSLNYPNNEEELEEEKKEDRYEVEKIIDKCIIQEKIYYWVKWRDYDYGSCTWESIDNLDACQSLIDQFEERTAAEEYNARYRKMKRMAANNHNNHNNQSRSHNRKSSSSSSNHHHKNSNKSSFPITTGGKNPSQHKR